MYSPKAAETTAPNHLLRDRGAYMRLAYAVVASAQRSLVRYVRAGIIDWDTFTVNRQRAAELQAAHKFIDGEPFIASDANELVWSYTHDQSPLMQFAEAIGASRGILMRVAHDHISRGTDPDVDAAISTMASLLRNQGETTPDPVQVYMDKEVA